MPAWSNGKDASVIFFGGDVGSNPIAGRTLKSSVDVTCLHWCELSSRRRCGFDPRRRYQARIALCAQTPSARNAQMHQEQLATLAICDKQTRGLGQHRNKTDQDKHQTEQDKTRQKQDRSKRNKTRQGAKQHKNNYNTETKQKQDRNKTNKTEHDKNRTGTRQTQGRNKTEQNKTRQEQDRNKTDQDKTPDRTRHN